MLVTGHMTRILSVAKKIAYNTNSSLKDNKLLDFGNALGGGGDNSKQKSTKPPR